MPWIVAHQAPLSMNFPAKNTGVDCHFLLQRGLPDPGIKPASPALAGGFLAVNVFKKEKKKKKTDFIAWMCNVSSFIWFRNDFFSGPVT